MGINRNEKRHEFTRGAEVMRHEFSLYFSAVFFSFGLALVAAIGTAALVLSAAISADEREVFITRLIAAYNVADDKPNEAVRMDLVRGDKVKSFEIPSARLLAHTAPEWSVISRKLWYTSAFSAVCGTVLFFLTNWSWRQFGRKVGRDEVVRGTRFADPAAVKRELEQAGKASPVTFAGVPLERGNEVLNTMVSGAIGTGKSVAITEALLAIRRSGAKAIVFDPTGEYIQAFYREGRDVILNPFDARSPAWTPWNEVRQPYDYANLAESFLPVMNHREPFWEEGAQVVLEDLMSQLSKHGEATNRRLVEVINVLKLSEIQEVVKSKPAAVYMDPDAAKTALGIRMNVVRAAKALRYLADAAPEKQFSIRSWITGPEQDSWLFLSTREDMLATMRPLITAWLDTAARAVMTMSPDRNRLMWNVVDELASLNKINSLKEVTTRARKYGLASILGYQNIAQLREIYGQNDAQTIVSMCHTTLTLRVPDFQTAEYIAKNLGSQEIHERGENFSYGADSTRDGVTITTRLEDRALVMPAQIQGLPDLAGYLRLAGRNDVMRVKFEFKDMPAIAAPFVDKGEVTYALDE